MDILNVPTIPEFYRGRKVLVTGGTGFVGKVLTEKLLRSCPDIDTVYLLLRAKKGRDAQARLRDITDEALFDRIKEENPAALSKLVAVGGDVKELGLGLSEEDRRLLQDSVSVVFHSAASVRFDDPIRDAVLVNVRGTRELVELALGMRNLKVVLHVSTTYSNCDRLEVKEELYPPPGDWRVLLKLVERTEEDHLLRCITHKIIGNHPNTYTYTKAVAEQLINDFSDQIPVVIVRPSIVVSAMKEPMPGWIDNYNGLMGLMLAGGKGVLRTVFARQNVVLNLVPVDAVVNSMIFIAWLKATTVRKDQDDPLPVYNCCSLTYPDTLYGLIQKAMVHVNLRPMSTFFWYPRPTMSFHLALFYVQAVVFHVLPAFVADTLLLLAGRKPMLVKLQRRVYIAVISVMHFNSYNFVFHNEKLLDAHKAMHEKDVEDFSFDKYYADTLELMGICYDGARKHLLKETPSPRDRVVFNRFYWLDIICKSLLVLSAIYMFRGIIDLGLAYVINTLLPVYNIL